jgi:hypothetical protein
VKQLAPLRGRKQIVLLSDGFAEWAWASAPSWPVSAADSASFARVSDSPEGEPLLGRMEAIFREAGQSDVVIHTISLNGNAEARGGQQPQGAGLDNMLSVRRAFNQNSGRSTLASMAENTGGRFILPTNDFGKALDEVDRISRHSYVIAFEATDPADPSHTPRKLKVRVRGTGLSVSHRASYATNAPAKTLDAQSIGVQAREAISKGLTGGPLRLHLATLPYRDLKGKASVHAVLQIDGVALAEAAQGKDLAVQVYGYAMAQGRVLDSMALNTSVDLSRFGAAVRNSGIRVITAFPASSEPLDLRFFVRTGASGVTGSIQRNVSMPSFAPDEAVLSAPIFTVPRAGKVVVPFQPANRPWIKVPFQSDGEPFVPDASAVLTPGRAREVRVFVWPARKAAAAPLVVTAEMTKAGENPLPLHLESPPRVVSDLDGFDRYIFVVTPPGSASGAYTLRLMFLDLESGVTSHTETAVVVGQ